MPPHARSRHVWIATALGVAAAHAGTPPADPAPPDTSQWKCEQCPFFRGSSADVSAGVLQANGANDSYGRYTGIDHNGVYADVAADGQWGGADGGYATYRLENLGLPSREAAVEAGQQGRYDVKVDYDGQPLRRFDTTVTPFVGAGPQLTLPANWQPAGSTGGMSGLGAALHPVDIESDRRTTSVLGRWFASSAWTVYGEFRHEEKEGTGLTGGSFLTDAAQLPRPIDYDTNSFEAGAAWAGHVASARFSYTGSWFTDNRDSLAWSNPYLPVVPGSTEGRLALPPDNNLQQLSVSGEVHLPLWIATSLNYSVSLGELKQDAAFLPVSTLPGSPALVQGSLDGDVHVSHYALSLASRPLPRLYIRGNATYDGRDDHTSPLAVTYIVTDALPGTAVVAPRYGEDRTRFDGSIDYRLFSWVRVGTGGQLIDTHYAPGQVLTYLDDRRGWVQVTINALSSVSLTLKGGNGRRDASSFNPAALPPTENPSLRAFDYAPRDRNFYSLSGSWDLTSTLSWSVEGSFADDAYRLSPIGLQDGHDRSGSTTLTWTPRDALSVHLNGGYQRTTALQRGQMGPDAPVWEVNDTQRYWTLGAGGRWALNERWDLSTDYVHAISTVGTDVAAGGSPQAFPENRSKLDSLRLDATYHWNRALRVRFRYGYERYDSNDWALDDVGVAAAPGLLALGALPYRHNVNVFGISALYEIGARSAPAQ